MVTIDRERLISEERNNKASAEGARLPKEPMLLRDIFKLQSHPWTRFVLLDSSAGLAKAKRSPPIALTLTLKNNLTQSTRLKCHLLLNKVRFDVTANRSSQLSAREESGSKDAGSNHTDALHQPRRSRLLCARNFKKSA